MWWQLGRYWFMCHCMSEDCCFPRACTSAAAQDASCPPGGICPLRCPRGPPRVALPPHTPGGTLPRCSTSNEKCSHASLCATGAGPRQVLLSPSTRCQTRQAIVLHLLLSYSLVLLQRQRSTSSCCLKHVQSNPSLCCSVQTKHALPLHQAALRKEAGAALRKQASRAMSATL